MRGARGSPDRRNGMGAVEARVSGGMRVVARICVCVRVACAWERGTRSVGGIGKAVATIGRIAMQRQGCLHCSGRMFDWAWISRNTDGAGG